MGLVEGVIMADRRKIPMISVVGASGAGKTTLMEKVVSQLRRRGIRVGTIKHDVHGFEMDRPGKDSWRHKKAGASVSMISSPKAIGMVMDVNHDHSPQELIPFFNGVDIILAEGYKHHPIPKIEVVRKGIHRELFCRDDPNLLAVVSDHDLALKVPCFSPDQVEEITEFLIDKLLVVEKRVEVG